MEKVKIFTSASEKTGFPGLENEINKWLSENDDEIEIVSRHVVGSAGINTAGSPFVNTTVTFFYTKKVSSDIAPFRSELGHFVLKCSYEKQRKIKKK